MLCMLHVYSDNATLALLPCRLQNCISSIAAELDLERDSYTTQNSTYLAHFTLCEHSLHAPLDHHWQQHCMTVRDWRLCSAWDELHFLPEQDDDWHRFRLLNPSLVLSGQILPARIYGSQ